ncbi:MAG TPA: HAD family phosphatase [Solirubrobacteraceae bacterium]|nr:HAD family phosphatase [Solirubrobacteraceae bacterium]
MSPDARMRGLLIDWGGVLTTDVFASFQQFCRNEGLDETLVRDLFRADPEARHTLFALETGELTEPEFEERFARILGLREDRAPGLVDRLFGGMKEDIAMFDAVRTAKAAGIRTGLLSNSWGVDRYDRGQFPRFFDAVVISGEEGVRKPDRAIYEIALERMALPASQIVFVDDLAGNLKPAQDLGMATVHHVSAQQSVPQLERLLGMPLR